VNYEDFASASVKVIESTGGAIMVIGGVVAFARYVLGTVRHGTGAYRQLRANLGRVILLGLEVLIIADIVRTIVVDQSVQSVGVLGLIVVIRIVLSFSLEVEIEGAWPWNEWRAKSVGTSAGVDGSAGQGAQGLRAAVARGAAASGPPGLPRAEWGISRP